MRRIAVIPAALALLAGTVSGASASSSTPTPVAQAVVAACHPSDNVGERFATFVGQMQAVKGTQRMAMHFSLLERLELPSFQAVSPSALRPWRRSKRGGSSVIYSHRGPSLRDVGHS